MKEHIQQSIDNLADHCLADAEVYHGYTDRDMLNATLVFSHFFMDKIYEYHKGKLTQEGMERLAEEAGKSLRQTVQLFTGLDMHVLAKQ